MLIFGWNVKVIAIVIDSFPSHYFIPCVNVYIPYHCFSVTIFLFNFYSTKLELSISNP